MSERQPSPARSAGSGDREPAYSIHGATHRAGRPEPALYLVATPIGNLGDITLRALEIMAGADRLACEDTRVSAKLLQRYRIDRKATPYHEHNAERAGAALVADLAAGLSVALISDAGTPLVSDPGYKLARAAIEAGVPVVPIPGPSAAMAALTASGLPCDAFFFAGFPPARQKARAERFAELAGVPGTLVFFEAPHRVAESLEAMAEVFGAREAAVCRELTKAHETTTRDTLPALARAFAEAERIRGEIVVCVAPPQADGPASDEEADLVLADLLERMKPADAAREAVKLTGLARKELYRRALAMKADR